MALETNPYCRTIQNASLVSLVRLVSLVVVARTIQATWTFFFEEIEDENLIYRFKGIDKIELNFFATVQQVNFLLSKGIHWQI